MFVIIIPTSLNSQTSIIKKDFFAFFINKISFEEIHKASIERNFTVVLLPEVDRFEKYTSDVNMLSFAMSKTQYHELYLKAQKSFDQYQNLYNSNSNVSRKSDGSDYLQTPIALGYDKYGRQVATPQEIAAKQKEAEGKKNKEPSVDANLLCRCRLFSYWDSHKDVCNTEEKKAGLGIQKFWESSCPVDYSFSKDSYGGNNSKDLILKYDKDNEPY